jgi:hypothetical protein
MKSDYGFNNGISGIRILCAKGGMGEGGAQRLVRVGEGREGKGTGPEGQLTPNLSYSRHRQWISCREESKGQLGG